eukprot:4992805-Prymnesium_polylepis.1
MIDRIDVLPAPDLPTAGGRHREAPRRSAAKARGCGARCGSMQRRRHTEQDLLQHGDPPVDAPGDAGSEGSRARGK